MFLISQSLKNEEFATYRVRKLTNYLTYQYEHDMKCLDEKLKYTIFVRYVVDLDRTNISNNQRHKR